MLFPNGSNYNANDQRPTAKGATLCNFEKTYVNAGGCLAASFSVEKPKNSLRQSANHCCSYSDNHRVEMFCLFHSSKNRNANYLEECSGKLKSFSGLNLWYTRFLASVVPEQTDLSHPYC